MKRGAFASIGALTAAFLMAGSANATTYIANSSNSPSVLSGDTVITITTNTATPDQFTLEIDNPTGPGGVGGNWAGATTFDSFAVGDAWSSSATLSVTGTGITGSIAGVDTGQNSSGCDNSNAAFVCFTLPAISVISNPDLLFTITASSAVDFSSSSPPDLKVLFENSDNHINGGGQFSASVPLSCSGNDCSPGTHGAIPEPGTWAMMIVGFGAIGAAMRMRRKAVFAAI